MHSKAVPFWHHTASSTVECTVGCMSYHACHAAPVSVAKPLDLQTSCLQEHFSMVQQNLQRRNVPYSVRQAQSDHCKPHSTCTKVFSQRAQRALQRFWQHSEHLTGTFQAHFLWHICRATARLCGKRTTQKQPSCVTRVLQVCLAGGWLTTRRIPRATCCASAPALADMWAMPTPHRTLPRQR